MDQDRRAQLNGLGAVLLWSTVATAFKISLRYLEPAQLLFWATFFAIVVLALLLSLSKGWTHVAHATRADLRASALLGFLNPFVYYTILFQSYDRLPAQIAQPLNFTWAIMLSVLAVPLLHQKLRRRDLIALVVCYSGVVILCSGGRIGGAGYDPIGIALGLVSAVVWALYWIFNTRSRLDALASLFLGFVFALPLVTLYALLTTGISTGGWTGLAGAAYVGAVEMGFAFALWLRAMKLTRNTSKIANLIFLAPFLSLLLIALVLGESIHPSTGIGLVLIVTGLLLQQSKTPSAAEAQTPAS